MNRLSIASALALVASAAPRLGGCPKDYHPMATFDVNRYTGLWYEIVRDKYTIFEWLQGCDLAEYTANDDGTITVHNMGHRFIQGWTDVKAAALPADTGDASLVVSFNGEPDASGTPNYTVLDTDYETYSIVYACGDFHNLASFDFLWVLAREPELPEATMLQIAEKIEAVLPNYGFFENHKMTHQGRFCPYDSRPL